MNDSRVVTLTSKFYDVPPKWDNSESEEIEKNLISHLTQSNDGSKLNKCATVVIHGISQFLIEHSKIQEDIALAKNIDILPLTDDKVCATLNLKNRYGRFIRVVEDAENFHGATQTSLPYWEHIQKIESLDITTEYNRYLFNNPGILIDKQDNAISFPILNISKTAFSYLNQFPENKCTLF